MAKNMFGKLSQVGSGGLPSPLESLHLGPVPDGAHWCEFDSQMTDYSSSSTSDANFHILLCSASALPEWRASISRSSEPQRVRHVKHSGMEDPTLACSLHVIHSCSVWFSWWKGHFSSVNSIALSFCFDLIHWLMLLLLACKCGIDSRWNIV